MKNIFIILLLVGCVIRSSAQSSFLTTPGANIKATNNAYIVLDNVHVVNNGSFVQAIGNGTTKFMGNTDVNISGSSIITFDKLNLEKTGSKVTLQQNANVAGQVSFTSGLLDLNNSVLNLGTTGTITGETETKRIFTLGNGYVQVINVLNMPVSANPGNLGAIITSTKNLGSVTIRRGHFPQPNVSGTTPGIRRYYDILPANDNGLKATLRFQYFDAELNGLNEFTLELWKQGKKNWTNEGYTSRSAVSNFVEKTGIGALSRWTLSGALNPLLVNNAYTTPVKEISEIKNRLSVWPNPVIQFVNVTINAANASTISLRLYDTKGSLILMRQEKLSAGENLMSIDMRKLATGTYNLIAEWGAGFRKIKQLIKQ
jgi:type IX secretion system substrate protein